MLEYQRPDKVRYVTAGSKESSASETDSLETALSVCDNVNYNSWWNMRAKSFGNIVQGWFNSANKLQTEQHHLHAAIWH